MELGRWLGCRGKHAVETKARRESVALCLEMDVARARIVGVAHQEIDIANDRRLVRQIADIGREIVIRSRRVLAIEVVLTEELDGALGASREALDEAIDFISPHFLGDDRCPIHERDVVERVARDVRRDGDDDRSVFTPFFRTQSMVKQELARESFGERERCGRRL